jgi:histone H3/H4
MRLSRFLAGMDENTMNVDEQQRHLLDALRFFVGKITEQQLSPKIASHQFVSALAGLSFTILVDHLPKELLAFAKHAGRKVIRDEDLFLYLRKTSLQEHLREYRDSISDSPKKPGKRGGRRPKDQIVEDPLDVE